MKNDKLAGLMYYMKEREAIRLKKEGGEKWPWTGDKILQTYKFTNVKRAHDRTTKAFVAHYKKHYDPDHNHGDEVLLYNCGVARYFGTVDYQRNLGWMKKHDKGRLVKTAQAMFKRGEQVFTGAYMITNAQRFGPKEKVVADFLRGLWASRRDIIQEIEKTNTWEGGYNEMSKLPGFKGTGFMTKEVLQDFLLVTTLPIYDAEDWTPMGPGARRGMNRLMGRKAEYRQPEAAFIGEVQDLWKQLKDWWKDTYPKAENLTAHDVQFCLCEFDKYERTRLKQGRPRSTYKPQVIHKVTRIHYKD